MVGVLHGREHLSCPVQKLVHEATSPIRSQILSCVLWDITYPSYHLYLHRDERPREDLWSGRGQRKTSSYLGRSQANIHIQLWCWVSLKWNFLRIAVLYGFMW